eukprot:TRINITY_DN37683_c0_g2_i1.p1 TRINITY_DN37683_c0_g2~~TRINITY_DN37683_c0_g2_i1.p1  ORF type:complete len:769 (+),score=186.47 TRINITY_DN37683_c0_g2_i1:101-2407(+)
MRGLQVGSGYVSRSEVRHELEFFAIDQLVPALQDLREHVRRDLRICFHKLRELSTGEYGEDPYMHPHQEPQEMGFPSSGSDSGDDVPIDPSLSPAWGTEEEEAPEQYEEQYLRGCVQQNSETMDADEGSQRRAVAFSPPISRSAGSPRGPSKESMPSDKSGSRKRAVDFHASAETVELNKNAVRDAFCMNGVGGEKSLASVSPSMPSNGERKMRSALASVKTYPESAPADSSSGTGMQLGSEPHRIADAFMVVDEENLEMMHLLSSNLDEKWDEGLHVWLWTDTVAQRARMLPQQLERLVQSAYWDFIVVCLVVSNAALIGLETDVTARDIDAPAPIYLRWAEYTYCALFTVELACRMYVSGLSFFLSSDWAWNFFDIFVVGSQLADTFCDVVLGKADMLNQSFVRIVRVSRLLRIMRLVRLLHLIPDLRNMVNTIAASFQSLFWSLLLFFMLIYIVSVFFLQSVSDLRQKLGKDGRAPPQELTLQIDKYYSSIYATAVSLWGAISGGVDWSDVMEPLTTISPLMGFVFILYIAFCTLAMMNVITGIFVETAIKDARAQEDKFVVNSIVTFFDRDDEEVITWNEFEEHLASEAFQGLLESLAVNPSDARGLFQLIDVDSEGQLTAQELTAGWIHLQGQAKTLDLALHARKFDMFVEDMERKLEKMTRMVQMVSSNVQATIGQSSKSVDSEGSNSPKSRTSKAGRWFNQNSGGLSRVSSWSLPKTKTRYSFTTSTRSRPGLRRGGTSNSTSNGGSGSANLADAAAAASR